MGNDPAAVIRRTCGWLVRLDHRFRPSDFLVGIRWNGLLELPCDLAGIVDVRHRGHLRPPSTLNLHSNGPIFHGPWPMANVAAGYCGDLSVFPGEAVLSLAGSTGMGIAD